MCLFPLQGKSEAPKRKVRQRHCWEHPAMRRRGRAESQTHTPLFITLIYHCLPWRVCEGEPGATFILLEMKISHFLQTHEICKDTSGSQLVSTTFAVPRLTVLGPVSPAYSLTAEGKEIYREGHPWSRNQALEKHSCVSHSKERRLSRQDNGRATGRGLFTKGDLQARNKSREKTVTAGQRQ